jgi:hypothetical protein
MSELPARPAKGTRKGATASETAIREARLIINNDNLAATGINELVSLWRDAGLRDFDLLACEDTGAVVQVHVEEDLPEERLASVDCVDQWANVSERAGGALYVIEFTAPSFPPSVAAKRDDLLDTSAPELHDDGLSFSLIGPLESVVAAIDGLEANGFTTALQRIGPYTSRSGPLDALTERQQEVVTTAFDLGYYEVPPNRLREGSRRGTGTRADDGVRTPPACRAKLPDRPALNDLVAPAPLIRPVLVGATRMPSPPTRPDMRCVQLWINGIDHSDQPFRAHHCSDGGSD